MRWRRSRSKSTDATAALRATLESGVQHDDPSEDALFEFLSDLENGDGTFMIVERLSDATGQTYIQTSRNPDGAFVVEYRDGDAGQHFRTLVPDMRAAHSVMTGWAFELPGWVTASAWERITISS